jgi:signal transduction histidine kinase
MPTEGAHGVSLRRRLLRLLVPATALLWLLGAALLYLQALSASQRLFDRSLAATAGMLLRLTEHEIEEDGVELGIALIRVQADPALPYLKFQIWTPLMRQADDGAGIRSLAPPDQEGYGWARIDGRRWRTFAVWNAVRSVQVQVAEEISQREAYSLDLYRRLALLALLWIPLSALLVGWILKRSFRPLGALANAVTERSPEDLRAVPASDAPAEVAPLLAALNRLFDRMRSALQLERRFTADAAHELRSPLAAIRANAQVMRNARSPEELSGAAGDLLASVDRSSHLIDQLLLLARLDAEGATARELAPLDLAPLVEAACGEQREFAATRAITLHHAGRPATVRGAAALLAILLRNLLDNAIRYSPPDTDIVVIVSREAGHARAMVRDQGPGIPAGRRAEAMRRFARLGSGDAEGSGLGLSIVARVAELHAATFILGEAPLGRGLEATLRFPAA